MTHENAHSVWLIDDDQSIRWVLERALTSANFAVTMFETASSALSRYKRIPANERPQLILTDIRMPGISGFELLKQIKNVDSKQPVIIMTAYSDLDTTVQGYQQGAFEYLPKPFDIDEAIVLVTRGCDSHSRKQVSPGGSHQNNEIIGSSLAIQNLFRKMGKLLPFNNHLLITGEHGTGKTITAQAVHLSTAITTPLASISLSASTTEHDIAELIAPFQQNPNVTVLLKNIDMLSKQSQSYLLKVLSQSALNYQTSTVVRIIATTTSNLHALVQSAIFDLALYDQLNETTITTPPLRERRSDIPILINHYLNQFCNDLNEETITVEADAMIFLQQYEWAGNVSQLRNLCRNMSISPERKIGLKDLPSELFETQLSEILTSDKNNICEWEHQLGIWAMRELATGQNNILPEANLKFERILLECALQVSKGRKHEAAKLLGWGRNTLTRKLKEFY
jgi:two-component system nitrogen regulation response regulator GlnG